MVRMRPEDAAIWQRVAAYVDSTEGRELLSYLACTPLAFCSQRDLAAHFHGDQLTLLAVLAELRAAGLVEAVRQAEGPRYRLMPTQKVHALVNDLPAYYDRSRKVHR